MTAPNGNSAGCGPQISDAISDYQIFGANAWPSATVNTSGGAVNITGGKPVLPGTTGSRGGVRLGLGQDFTNFSLCEVVEPAVGQRAIALCQLGGGITSTQLPANTGDGVIWIGNAAVNPTASPVGGAIL